MLRGSFKNLDVIVSTLSGANFAFFPLNYETILLSINNENFSVKSIVKIISPIFDGLY